MARANRHVIPGQVWHITHRCHKKQWLLKFARDRSRWMYWLFEARRRFGLVVLNFVVTSNHVHLLVQDQGQGEIWRSMQLVAGRTAQEYNQRKARVGAFWQDRYHATAVQSDHHLQRCLTYIDMNMVRAGVVHHPAEWMHSGYVETLNPRDRYQRLDLNILVGLVGATSVGSLSTQRALWVDEALDLEQLERNPVWTESVAVGNRQYVDDIQTRLKVLNPRLTVDVDSQGCHLREDPAILKGIFGPKNRV